MAVKVFFFIALQSSSRSSEMAKRLRVSGKRVAYGTAAVHIHIHMRMQVPGCDLRGERSHATRLAADSIRTFNDSELQLLVTVFAPRLRIVIHRRYAKFPVHPMTFAKRSGRTLHRWSGNLVCQTRSKLSHLAVVTLSRIQDNQVDENWIKRRTVRHRGDLLYY